MPRLRSLAPATLALLVVLGGASPLLAQDDATARAHAARIAELEKQMQALTEELARLRTEVAVPEEKELKSAYGLGPAASKVYGVERGVSIGGYGEIVYRDFVGDDSAGADSVADALRAVLYLGYKFSDTLVFNSEIEFEHGSTSAIPGVSGGGSTSIEFAAVDWFLRPEFNLRAGMLLTPMGFVNELHEPPYFYGVDRPRVEQQIIPSTWRNPGVGVFGDIGESFSYRAYLMSGQNGQQLGAGGSIRATRQKGNRAHANDIALVLRGDFEPPRWPGLLFGGSLYVGEVDQDQVLSRERFTMENAAPEVSALRLPDTRMWIGEAHLQYRQEPLSLRALFAYTKIDGAGALSRALGLDADCTDEEDACTCTFNPKGSIGEEHIGGYAEIGYDLFDGGRTALELFARLAYVDTHHGVAPGYERDRTKAYWLRTLGVQFYPHPNVVFKAEYRDYDADEGARADNIGLGVGFAF